MNIPIPKTPPQAEKVMNDILNGKHSTPELAALLRYYQEHPPSPKIMQAFLRAVRNSALFTIHTGTFDTPVIDIAGSGGDGKHTVNISTLAGIFCAATGLVKVAKYGNRAATGFCGSMDVLEGNGIDIDLSLTEIEQNLHQSGFSPVFARAIYPGAKCVAEARKQLSGPTIFNLLFPLARPIAGEPRFVFGVANEHQLKPIVELYLQEQHVRCAIIHGLDGTDEVSVSTNGLTKFVLIDHQQVVTGILDCKNLFNFNPVDISQLQISSHQEAVRVFAEVCDPQINRPNINAIRQAVFANAAVALFTGLDNQNMDITIAKKYLPVLEKKFQSGQVLKLFKTLQMSRKERL